MFKRIFAVVLPLVVTIIYAEWKPDPLCPYPSDQITNFQYFGNCSVYWSCYQGSKFLVECPQGLEFDVVTKNCTSPDAAQCDPYASTTTSVSTSTSSTESSSKSTISTTDSTTSSSESSSTTSSQGTTTDPYDPNCPDTVEEITYVPYKGDCSKYWECYEGSGYLYTCPTGLWWHQELLECDYPGDFCINTTSTSPTSATSSTKSTTPSESTTGSRSTSTGGTTANPDDVTCPNPNDTPVYFPISGDCVHYWECFEGNKFLNSCENGQWWHQEAGVCDSPGDFCIPTFVL